MSKVGWQFELRYGGDHMFHPENGFQIFRSDDMIGDGGRIMLLNASGKSPIEVPYRDLSGSSKEIAVGGQPMVRVRRVPDGRIVGEWIPQQAEHPGGAVPHVTRAAERPADAPDESGDALAGALRLASGLLGQSSSSGLRNLGSFLAKVSQDSGGASAAGVPKTPPARATPGERVQSSPAAVAASLPTSTARAEVVHPPATAPPGVPSRRNCEQCAFFRPYSPLWARFQQELAGSGDEAVSRGLDEIRTMEQRGQGEEAKHLANLFRRGADRWTTRPSFFSYCAAHESDATEPTFFIPQIRNADQRCRPVKRLDGKRWNDAPTDFLTKDTEPHRCATCAHRIRAPGPGKDAQEVREVVAAAISADQLGAFHGKAGGSSVAGSFADSTRRNSASARAREMAQAFASRAADSHAPIEPRYLDRCGLKSDAARDRFRVCAVENANDCCPEWTPC